jgi:anti-sigma regulatory factor (Ser/Thr protein kinase)
MSVPRTLTLHNRLSELDRLADELTAFGQAQRLPKPISQALHLALDEIVTNIIAYGYDDQADHQISLRLSLEAGEVTAEVEDDARPFNPLEAPAPDLTAPLEERSEGGLGIHLARTVMDRLEYRRQNGKNYLVMRKRVSG